MKITPDTNVLVRVFIEHDAAQSAAAQAALRDAALIALTLPALCEVVWVLSYSYKRPAPAIAAAIRLLIDSDNVVVNRPAVEAGLAMLDAGGDFADGVIAHEGGAMGARTFVSFDKDAIRLIEAQGGSAHVPR